LLGFAELSGWYEPGPTMGGVEFNWINGSKPFTERLAYRLNSGFLGTSGLRQGSYWGPGVILYFFSSGGNLGSPPNLVFGSWNLLLLSASFTSN
jgi:hypothetical protein